MMVEISVPRFSDFYGGDLTSIDQDNPMVPVEIDAEEILEMSRQKGFKILVKQVEGFEGRRIIFVDPGINLEQGRAGTVAFCEHDGRLYINNNESWYITELFLAYGPMARREGLVG